MQNEDYLLGDDDGELYRLGVQHRVWAEVTHACWRRAGFGIGDHILDLGCGPGLCTLELAQWVGPTGQVIAVDQSPGFLETVEQRARGSNIGNISTRLASVDELELEDESLDGAFLRWLLCFLPDPGLVIKRIARALKPGASLVTLDYFNYRAFTLSPRSPAMELVVAAIQASWKQSGGSLDVSGSVPMWMEDAGLTVTETRQVSGLARPGSARWNWPENFLGGFLPSLVEGGFLDDETLASFWADWHQRASRPGSFLVLPPLFEIHGVR
jgi:SAM-dependent methyltransferase